MDSVGSSSAKAEIQSNNNEQVQQTNPVSDVTKIKDENISDQSTNNDSTNMNITNNNNNSNNNNNNNNNSSNNTVNDMDEDDDQEYDDDEGRDYDDGRNQNGTRNDSMDDNEKTNLIVNYLPQNMTDNEFEELFKRFGQMKSCKIVRNRMTGYSYGFGFVDFDTHEQALKAIDELNGHEVDKKKIKVAFARPAGQDIKQANLYVKNVPSTWSQDDVKKVFAPYGQIIQVRVLENRGVAFVLFDLRKQAEEAMEALNGKEIDGCEVPLEIKFAADKKRGEGDKRGNKSGGGRNGSGRRGGGDRGGVRNQNNNRNNRSNSNQGRGTSQGRGSGDRSGGRMFNKGNTNNNSNFDNMNGSIGPVRQQQGNRMSRYAPFVPVPQQPPMAPQQPTAPMNPYGYAQQPMMPYMTPNQPIMMQMNPMAQQSLQMGGPVGPYSIGAGAQMGPIGYAQPPMVQPSAAMNNMYNVASNTMNNAAQMQPQLGQPMNMRGPKGGGGGGATAGGHGGGGGNSDGVTLFVYNIGPNSDENELRTIFGPYGDVLRCNVVRKTPGGETKGFGFVTVRSKDQANAAISGLNGQMRNGKPLQVSFKK